ncbi:DUF5997 family protein [Frigoribacterium sp. 2-23]|uniref:DUF5997 family protein n=1 Tax=Frigoribacterium sp. 2-23 TaxID=3415006 RepID=UPI003C6EFED0
MTSDSSGTSPQTLKPFTAAKKLGVYLPATPDEFQNTPLTREQFAEISANPPEWLAELRRTGPHPRPVVAQKLGISTSGLARAGVDDVMTTEQIKSMLAEMPAWLVEERASLAAVRDEEQRIKERDAERAAKAAREAR